MRCKHFVRFSLSVHGSPMPELVLPGGSPDLEEVPLACNPQLGKYMGTSSTKEQIKKQKKRKQKITTKEKKQIKVAGSLDGKSV